MFPLIRRTFIALVLLCAGFATLSPLVLAASILSPTVPATEVSLDAILSLALLCAVGIVAAPDTTPSSVKKNTNTRKKERSSEDVSLAQAPPITLPGLQDFADMTPDIIKVDGRDVHVSKDYLAELAFNDELVEIMIHPSSEAEVSPTTELVSVGGIWAEVLLDSRGQFCQSKRDHGRMQPWGYLDRGVKFVTRRKYVEQLAKSRHTTVRTDVLNRQSERPDNQIRRVTNMKFPFQVFNDETPKAVDWLYRILR